MECPQEKINCKKHRVCNYTDHNNNNPSFYHPMTKKNTYNNLPYISLGIEACNRREQVESNYGGVFF